MQEYVLKTSFILKVHKTVKFLVLIRILNEVGEGC